MPSVANSIGDLLVQVRTYLSTELTKFGADGGKVVLGNIALVDEPTAGGGGSTGNGGLSEATVLTLVRATQDPTRRNQANYRYKDAGSEPVDRAQGYVFENPPVRLDLDLLVTANYRIYEDALDILSRTIAIFQRDAVVPGVKVTTSLVPLSFEQHNHLWSMLGGKQRPAVLYRLQTADIAYVPTQGPDDGPMIEPEKYELVTDLDPANPPQLIPSP